MSVDRQSIKNDLIALSNTITRDESLGTITEELNIVIENIQELADQEFNANATTQNHNSHPGKDSPSSSHQG